MTGAAEPSLEMQAPVMERRPCSVCQIHGMGFPDSNFFPPCKWGEDGIGGWIGLNIVTAAEIGEDFFGVIFLHEFYIS